MPPVTTKNFWSVRPTPYRREAIKEGHVYSDPFFGLSLELWVGHIIGNTPTSILMLMRAVCLGWKQLIDPEIERRHKLLGVPVWLGNQPQFPLQDFHPRAMVIVTNNDIYISEKWAHFANDRSLLPIEALEYRRKTPEAGAGILGIPTNTQTVLINRKLNHEPTGPALLYACSDNFHVGPLNLPCRNDTRLHPSTLILWNCETKTITEKATVDRLIVIGGTFDTNKISCKHLILYSCKIPFDILCRCVDNFGSIFIDDCDITTWTTVQPVYFKYFQKASIGRIHFSNPESVEMKILQKTFSDMFIARARTLGFGAIHDEYLGEALRMPWKIERPNVITRVISEKEFISWKDSSE